MTTGTTNLYDIQFEDFSTVSDLVQNPSFEIDNGFRTLMRAQEFNLIQMTNSILNTLADWDKNWKGLSNIKLFKDACKKLIITCIIPLMVMLIEEDQMSQLTPSQISIKKQVLVKWWGTYMNILEEVFLEKSEEKGWSDDKQIWFPKKELKLWEKVWELVEKDHLWRIYLSKECCVGNLLFRPFFAKEERSQHCSEIFNFMGARIDYELQPCIIQRMKWGNM